MFYWVRVESVKATKGVNLGWGITEGKTYEEYLYTFGHVRDVFGDFFERIMVDCETNLRKGNGVIVRLTQVKPLTLM